MFKNITQILLAITAIELVSFLASFFPVLNSLIFILAIAIFVCLTVKNPFNGLMVVLVELILGSKGYHFALTLGEQAISIRIGLFLALMIIWLIKFWNPRQLIEMIKSSRALSWFFIVMVFIVFGVINGVMKGNGLGAVYSDVNNYLYLLLIFPALDIIKNRDEVMKVIEVTAAAITYLGLKTLFGVYLFSHNLGIFNAVFYKWIRLSGVGEVTRVSLDFSFHRVFFQSHIFSLIAILCSLALVYFVIKGQGLKEFWQKQNNKLLLGFLTLNLAVIIASFSRSFWLGLAVAFIIGAVIALKNIISLFKSSILLFLSGLTSIATIIVLVIVPIPTGGSFDFGALRDRLGDFSGEAAVSSRWNLLPPLMEQIKKVPLFGAGFGTAVTFQSNDPRIKTADNPSGETTTTSFEWGYLDTITEIGILGLLAVLIFILQILREGISAYKNSNEENKPLIVGLLLGLAAIIATHMFSPYLNHPLGLGYLVVIFTIFSINKNAPKIV